MLIYGTDEYNTKYKDLVAHRRKSETEPFVFLTPEWCSAFEAKVQSDERYKQVARNWEGSVVLVFRADAENGIKNDKYIYLDLWHGECDSLELVPEERGRDGDYVLEAEYIRWERILKGELNVVKELATRQLKLVPFDFPKAVKLAAASQAAIRLVELAETVATRYPGDLAAADRASLEKLFDELKSEYGI